MSQEPRKLGSKSLKSRVENNPECWEGNVAIMKDPTEREKMWYIELTKYLYQTTY